MRQVVAFIGFIAASGCAGERVTPDPVSDDTGEAAVTSTIEVVGTSETIARIADLALTPDGTIWVLNTADPFFIAMAPDGSVMREWGRPGGGPDEFRGPTTLVHDPVSGHLFAYDAGHHALMRVDGPESPIETIALPRDSIPPGRVVSAENVGAGGRAWILGTPSGFLVGVEGVGATDLLRLWDADVMELSRDGAVRRAFAVSDRLGDPASRYGNAATEFLPYPLWARCPDGSIAVYDPLGNAIIRLSAEDAVLDTIPLPAERNLELTFDRVFRMAWGFMRTQAPGGQMPDSAAMYAMLGAQWGELAAEAAGVFPEYADLQCPTADALWIQPFNPDEGQMGRGPDWRRIGDDGTSTTVRFPDNFRPLRFDSERVLGVLRGEFDIESVAWMDLPAFP